jgi:hypothetical protein
MSEQEIYQDFISWLGKTWWGLPASDQLMPLIQARYTVKEAAFLKRRSWIRRKISVNIQRGL